jgi:hypothetical protein
MPEMKASAMKIHKMMHKKMLLAAFGGLMLATMMVSLPQSLVAAEEAYFEALYDIPVMPGLEELKGDAVLFDKPDGRIASATAASRKLTPAQIKGFYAESLSQMGWKKRTQNQYVRGDDLLVLEVLEKPPLTVLHLTLSPLKP